MDDMTYGGYDYRQNQRLWQRVAPSMAPYPESAWPPAAGGGMAGAAGTGMASSAGMTPSGGAVSPVRHRNSAPWGLSMGEMEAITSGGTAAHRTDASSPSGGSTPSLTATASRISRTIRVLSR